MPRPASFCVLLLAFSLAVPAAAADRGLYVSFKAGSTDVQADFGDAFDQVLDGDDTSKTFELGFRLSRYWAVQAAYHDLGTVGGSADCVTPGCEDPPIALRGDSKAYSLAVLPQYPFGRRLSVFAKLGLVAWDSDIEAADGTADLVRSLSDEDLLYGFGVRVGLLGPLEVFYDHEWLGSEIESQSFGVTWQF